MCRDHSGIQQFIGRQLVGSKRDARIRQHRLLSGRRFSHSPLWSCFDSVLQIFRPGAGGQNCHLKEEQGLSREGVAQKRGRDTLDWCDLPQSHTAQSRSIVKSDRKPVHQELLCQSLPLCYCFKFAYLSGAQSPCILRLQNLEADWCSPQREVEVDLSTLEPQVGHSCSLNQLFTNHGSQSLQTRQPTQVLGRRHLGGEVSERLFYAGRRKLALECLRFIQQLHHCIANAEAETVRQEK